MFSTISHLIDLDGARVLDLYAGSGALGLEAASRGASRVVFVDSSKKATAVISTNIRRVTAALDPRPTLEALTMSASAYCRGLGGGESFDLAVLDPPYDTTNDDVVSCVASLSGSLTDNSVVVVERGKKAVEPVWPDIFSVIAHKTYGDTSVFYVRLRR